MQVMSHSVLSRLAEPYGDVDPEGALAFNDAIGVDVPSLGALTKLIDGDMDTTQHGVGWWIGHPIGDRRRILISDHLIECVRSVERNLVDARLHQMSLWHCDELETRLMRHMVSARRLPGGQVGLSMEFPRRMTAKEDLPRSLGDLHRVGFFRAIGSAFDCLGTAVVGVLGIPLDLLRSDLGQVRNWFRQPQRANGVAASDYFLRGFGRALEQAITDAGPVEWLEWTLDMRNMLVHRARRLQLATVHPRDSGLVTVDGAPQVLSDVATHLPKAPAHSEVEVMIATAFEPVLTEDAITTINGVFDSATRLVGLVAEALHRAWGLRRAQPNAVLQPRAQWANTPARPALRFPGYRPGSSPAGMDALLTNPTVVRRMQVAALSDTDRHKWSSFT